MNEALIENWNSVVQPDDEVWHLGDFCMGGTRPKDWLPRLNGNVHLIRGNHDPHVEDQGFASVQNYKELKINGRKITLLHFPMRSWNGSHKGTWHLFGHVHGTMTVAHGRKGVKDALAIDAGVDCHNYPPVSFEQVSRMMDKHADYLKAYFLKEGKGELSNKERKLRERMLKKEEHGGRAKDPYKRGRKAMRRR
jgi:calcineurin-like phosphoesterase family protein